MIKTNQKQHSVGKTNVEQGWWYERISELPLTKMKVLDVIRRFDLLINSCVLGTATASSYIQGLQSPTRQPLHLIRLI